MNTHCLVCSREHWPHCGDVVVVPAYSSYLREDTDFWGCPIKKKEKDDERISGQNYPGDQGDRELGS
jgi:hypothetical protein